MAHSASSVVPVDAAVRPKPTQSIMFPENPDPMQPNPIATIDGSDPCPTLGETDHRLYCSLQSRAYSKEFLEVHNISPFPSPSFLILSFLPVPCFPLEVGPLNPARRTGENSPSGFWDRAQTESEFGAFYT